MKDDHPARGFDPLEPLLRTAVEAILAEPLPGDALERVQRRAERLTAAPPAPLAPAAPAMRRWKSLRSFTGSVAAAAAIAAAAIGITLMQARPGGQVFAQMLENVRAAHTIQVHATIKLGKHHSDGSWYIDGNRSRGEQSDGSRTTIVDVDRRKILILDMRNKLYQWSHFDGEKAQEMANPIDKLRGIKSDDAELVGEEVLDGRRTFVYRINGAELILGGGSGDYIETMVWIDAESELPVKIVGHDPDPKRQLDVRFENFVWDEPLDPQLFSLEPPEGFEPIEPIGDSLDFVPVQPVAVP